MIVKGPATTAGEWGRNSHGGNGEYFVRTLLTTEFKSTLKYIRDLTLKAASSIGVHPHRDDEEIYFVISGHGTMIVDAEEQAVGPGDVVLTYAGSSHGLRADRGEELRIFVACAAVR